MSLRSRLHTAQHRTEGRAPQRIRLWSTVAIAVGLVMVFFSMELATDDAVQWWLTAPGALLNLLGVGGHLAAIEMEQIAEDGDHVGGEDW